MIDLWSGFSVDSFWHVYLVRAVVFHERYLTFGQNAKWTRVLHARLPRRFDFRAD